MLPLTRKAIAVSLLTILMSAVPVSMGEGKRVFIEDGRDDFIFVVGLRVKQPFLDIRNVTVDYDKPSDSILVTVGFFAPLPSRGPPDPPEKSSSYYYSCNFRTGENDTLDRTSVILEKGMNWSSAHLRSYIRGYDFEGSASPVKYQVHVDSIVFTMPAHILTWGERPKRLLITAEAGYESFKLPSGAEDTVYFDRAPEKSEGGSSLAFEVPPAPPNMLPLVVLAVVLAPSFFATWRLFRRHGSRSRKRRR
jgi:hypothetical protein